MGRPFGFRMLLAVSGALAVLLATLAILQYRWSARVAAADAQREREYLNSAAALFATQFNDMAGQTAEFLQTEAWNALQSGKPLTAVPKLIGEIYALDLPEKGQSKAHHLNGAGVFEPSSTPSWIDFPRCVAHAIQEPPALVVPVYNVAEAENLGGGGLRIVKAAARVPQGCMVARIDLNSLRDTVIPQLVRQSFGDTATHDYDFEVVSRARPDSPLYGNPVHADLQKPFFSISPAHLALAHRPPSPVPGQVGIIVQSVETIVTKGSPGLANLYGSGIWELEVAHKGLPLAASFERTRQRNLLISIGVELLLVAAFVFLVIAARRMQQLANQKMQFVAGVSHELRTPVSAISMLSRNQADGLVSGPEKVKQYGELIHQQSRRLNEMVEQTLQYAGIHSGLRKPARDTIDLEGLIREALDARRAELERDGFELEVAVAPELPPVTGDPNLLRTAFDNLLSNALKYAQGGHWIRVSVTHSAQEVQISVVDRGDGIDPADQAEIFEPFCRGRAAIAAQIPGSGLGLSLVRSVAEAHRGTVTLESAPGRGSTFTLHLPV